MKITTNNTVAEVVTNNIKTADIFKKHGIDFCCGGGITIQKACEKNQLDVEKLVDELTKSIEPTSNSFQYDTWELDYLAAHIEHVHHGYVVQSTPIIQQYAAKVAKVHGHHYSEVIEINTLFNEASKELAGHMKKEELILFPFIKKLAIASKNEEKIPIPHFGTVNNPIKMMEIEHENVGDILKKIKKLSNNYTPPSDACNTFKALYAKLEEFENDLHQHIHLENNILFPKAIVLEQKFGLN